METSSKINGEDEAEMCWMFNKKRRIVVWGRKNTVHPSIETFLDFDAILIFVLNIN